MDANILKEFLVKIGFSVDRAGLRALREGIDSVTRAVKGLVTAAVGMATAVVAAVTVTARALDELYYSAQRADSTAEGLLTVGHAARSVGLTAAGVRGQIEGLAASFRDMPPMRAWLAGITGARGTPEEMMVGFARYYARMRSQGRELLARMTLRAGGVDPESIRQVAMNLPAFLRSREEMSSWFRALGFNAGQATAASANFIRELNRSWGLFSSIWDKIATALLPILQVGLRNLNDLIAAHLSDIRSFVDGPLSDFVRYMTDPATWERWKRNIEDVAAAVRSEIGGAVDYVRGHWQDWSETIDRVWGQIRDGARDARAALEELASHRQAIGLGLIAFGVATKSPAMIVVGAGLVGSAPLPGDENYQPTNPAAPENQPQTNILGGRPWIDRLTDWLSGLTHSPNVDIYEAKGLWTRLKDWMSGSQSTVPVVNLGDETMRRMLGSLGYDEAGRPAGRGPGTAGRGPGPAGTDRSGGPQASRGARAAETGGAVSIPPGSDEAMARDAISRAGGNEKTQAGLLANFYAESGLRRDRPGPGGDFGWAQWVGPRKKALFALAAARGLSPYSAEAQAAFLYQELTTNPRYVRMIQQMNAAASATEAAKIGGFVYEQGGAGAHLFGGGRFSQAGLDAFHSRGAEDIYGRITRGTAPGTERAKFPPWVKYNSRGEPYSPDLDTMSAAERARVEQSMRWIREHPGTWATRPMSFQAPDSFKSSGGDQNVTISPQTTMHIHGDDPSSTARYVADAQGRVTAGMVRAFQPVAG